MTQTSYKGIDYGLGQSNVDQKTGIRYGVVSINSLNLDCVYDGSFDEDYGKPRIRPRLEAIRTGNQTLEARRWQRDFLDALHSRISSHITETGRKFAPEYTRYHLATYGNDWHYLNS